MQIKHYLLLLLGSLSCLVSYGQDLSRRIPADADLVVSFNNPAIFKHTTIEDVNDILNQLGIFSEMGLDKKVKINDIRDLGIDYERNAYIYKSSRDSIHYIGVLLPLRKAHNIQKQIMRHWTDLPTSNGYQRRISADKKMLGAWNDNMLFIFLGEINTFYFKDETVAKRYGLKQKDYNAPADYPVIQTDPYTYDDYETSDSISAIVDSIDLQTDTAVEEYEEEIALADTADTYWDGYDLDVDTTAEGHAEENGYTTYEWESSYDDVYADSAYQTEQNRLTFNNAIQDSLLQQWLLRDFEHFLSPAQSLSKNKQIRLKRNKTILTRVWVKDLDEIYKTILPFDVFKQTYGIALNDLNYGYQDAILDIVQDKNTLKISSSIGLDRDVQKMMKSIYNSKYNRKFARYVPENHLGYMTININTKSFINQLPHMLDRWYKGFLYDHVEILNVIGTSIEVAFDEKAISKVMRGDHVLFINAIQKVTREYKDYEYDENFDYTVVTKTKEEPMPNYLWMFTSEDQRIFKQVLAYGVRKNECTIQDDIYGIPLPKSTDTLYIHFKDDMVFLGNNLPQISSIRDNTFRASTDGKLKKELFKNTASFGVHIARIPGLLEDMEIPVVKSWNKTVQNLSKYGDMQAKMQGIRKGRISGELSLEFPKEEENALGYLLKQIKENAISN